jgi:hypothetical protein
VIFVSNSVQSVQEVNLQAQAQPAARAPKTPAQSAAPQDKVTISPQAQQALAKTTKTASSGDVDHDGDNH